MKTQTADDRPMTDMRGLLRDAWTIARPYWFSDDRWAGRGLLVAVIALNLGIVAINVMLNKWNNAFYNSLQDKNYDIFLQQLFRFTWLAGSFIVVAVYELYLNQMLQIRWRRWLTDRYLKTWLDGGAYYRMQLVAKETDNPDQRIAEDVRLFIAGASGAGGTLGLAIGGMRAVVTLVSFVAILWGLSGALTLPWVGLTVPAYLVWAALLYAIVGTWLTDLIGRPLVRLNFNQQRYEADFRFSPSRQATLRQPSSSPSWSRPRATSAARSRWAGSSRRPRPSARCRTRCPTSYRRTRSSRSGARWWSGWRASGARSSARTPRPASRAYGAWRRTAPG